MAYCVSQGWVGEAAGVEGVLGKVKEGVVGGGHVGVLGGVYARGTLAEVHPIVGVFVLWGCAMVSKSIHIPKP